MNTLTGQTVVAAELDGAGHVTLRPALVSADHGGGATAGDNHAYEWRNVSLVFVDHGTEPEPTARTATSVHCYQDRATALDQAVLAEAPMFVAYLPPEDSSMSQHHIPVEHGYDPGLPPEADVNIDAMAAYNRAQRDEAGMDDNNVPQENLLVEQARREVNPAGTTVEPSLDADGNEVPEPNRVGENAGVEVATDAPTTSKASTTKADSSKSTSTKSSSK